MNKKKLKTTRNVISELCSIDSDSRNLCLLGCEPLRDQYISYRKFDPCFSCSCNEFSCSFSSEDKFLYKLQHFSKESPIYSEIGIGELVSSNGSTCIKRLSTILSNSDDGIIPSPPFYTPRAVGSSEYLEVSPYYPSNGLELLIDPNTILFTTSDGVPSPLYVDKNSVILRMEDSIQSASINDFFVSILECFLSFSKSINLKASKLFCSILNCNQLVFSKKKKQSKPPRGTICWDAEDEMLKFYNGKSWMVINMVQDKS